MKYILLALLLTSCDKPVMSLPPDESPDARCTDDTLDERIAYVEQCIDRTCFEESVALFCERGGN